MLHLTPHADLDVFYEADSIRYRSDCPAVLERVTRSVFASMFADCASVGFESDGRPIGGIIFDGVRAHIAVLPEFHGRWAWLLDRALQWLFSLKSEIVVTIEPSNRRCIAFMERNGWSRIATSELGVVFRMTYQGRHRRRRAAAADS